MTANIALSDPISTHHCPNRSLATKKSVGVMLVGVTLATVSDVDVSFVGFLIGMVAVAGAGAIRTLQ